MLELCQSDECVIFDFAMKLKYSEVTCSKVGMTIAEKNLNVLYYGYSKNVTAQTCRVVNNFFDELWMARSLKSAYQDQAASQGASAKKIKAKQIANNWCMNIPDYRASPESIAKYSKKFENTFSCLAKVEHETVWQCLMEINDRPARMCIRKTLIECGKFTKLTTEKKVLVLDSLEKLELNFMANMSGERVTTFEKYERFIDATEGALLQVQAFTNAIVKLQEEWASQHIAVVKDGSTRPVADGSDVVYYSQAGYEDIVNDIRGGRVLLVFIVF